MRTITVEGKKFRYRVGKEMTVIRNSNNDVLLKIYNWALLGVTPDTFARGQWKRTSDGMVTPAHVAKRIASALERP